MGHIIHTVGRENIFERHCKKKRNWGGYGWAFLLRIKGKKI